MLISLTCNPYLSGRLVRLTLEVGAQNTKWRGRLVNNPYTHDYAINWSKYAESCACIYVRRAHTHTHAKAQSVIRYCFMKNNTITPDESANHSSETRVTRIEYNPRGNPPVAEYYPGSLLINREAEGFKLLCSQRSEFHNEHQRTVFVMLSDRNPKLL
jgi:hypothetical protein